MDYNILRLDVAMDDPMGVNFVNCLNDLLHDEGCSWFWKGERFFDLVEELTAHSDLEYDINIGGVLKTAVHFDYVRMVEEHLDLHFPEELFSDFLLLQ